jgi:prepilin peptidase CpaA
VHAVFIVALAVAAVAAWTDWRRGEIPNWLTYGALAVGPLAHVSRALAAHEPLDYAFVEGAFSIGGALTCALVPALLYRQGAIGGGDLKFLAAVGALLQTTLGVETQMYGFFAAALVAPARLAYDGKLIATLKNATVILTNVFVPKSRQRTVGDSALSLRLGPPVFLGMALTVWLHW